MLGFSEVMSIYSLWLHGTVSKCQVLSNLHQHDEHGVSHGSVHYSHHEREIIDGSSKYEIDLAMDLF